jgi:hypothetical protein
VGFQIAVSNSSGGPWNYKGWDGTANTYYTPVAGVTQPLDYNLFNYYRYFRVRTTLEADPSETLSPTVTDIVVDWSP